jgi:hypothetical protein
MPIKNGISRANSMVSGPTNQSSVDVWASRPASRCAGGNPEGVSKALRPAGSLHCYLELHIEQGGILERSAIPIGIVDGIVSIDDYAVEVQGFANHAAIRLPGLAPK